MLTNAYLLKNCVRRQDFKKKKNKFECVHLLPPLILTISMFSQGVGTNLNFKKVYFSLKLCVFNFFK